jgi:transcriptional regulator with XRE-family HTH domain
VAKSKAADYNGLFAKNLRDLLEKHPHTGERTTYNTLGTELGVKPQSVSQWANGDTTPDMKHIVPIARFFGVDANFLLTGVSAENETVWQDLGLHENSIRELKRMKKLGDNREIHSIAMLLIIDLLLRTDGLLRLYDMMNQYVYDVLEYTERVEADKEAFTAATEDPERKDDLDYINRLAQKMKSNEDNLELLWYKAAHKARDLMLTMIEKVGGFEQAEKKLFNSQGRMEKWDKELWGEDIVTGKEYLRGGE